MYNINICEATWMRTRLIGLSLNQLTSAKVNNLILQQIYINDVVAEIELFFDPARSDLDSVTTVGPWPWSRA